LGNLFGIPKSVGAAQSGFAILGKPLLDALSTRVSATVNALLFHSSIKVATDTISGRDCCRNHRSGCVYGGCMGAGLVGWGALIRGGTYARLQLEDSQKPPSGLSCFMNESTLPFITEKELPA